MSLAARARVKQALGGGPVLSGHKVDDSLRLETVIGGVALPPGIQLRTERYRDVVVSYLATRRTDEEVLARFLEGLRPPAGRRLVVGYRGDDARSYVVEEPPFLTGANLLEAQLERGVAGGPDAVSVTFDQAGRAALLRVTSAQRGRRVAFLLDGRIVTAPIVVEPVPGPKVVIAVGRPGEGATLVEPILRRLRQAATTTPLELVREEMLPP